MMALLQTAPYEKRNKYYVQNIYIKILEKVTSRGWVGLMCPQNESRNFLFWIA